MELTDKALKAAVKKAIEVGLLPKAGFIDVIEVNWRRVKDVVEVALAETEADVASRPRELFMDGLESVTPGPTRDLTITHCSACPFATRADPDQPACGANLYLNPESRDWYRLFEEFVGGDWVFPDTPPDWCPLRAQSMKIRIDAGDDHVR